MAFSRMKTTIPTAFIVAVVLHLGFISTASGLHCYQCDSLQDIRCNDDPASRGLQSLPCLLFTEPRYCIKMTEHLGNAVVTRRSCSERFLDTSCTSARQPGDQREYRSCVYTCQGDGCNGSNALVPVSKWIQFAAASLMVVSFISHQRI